MNDYIPGTKMPIYILDQLKNKNDTQLKYPRDANYILVKI